MFISIIKSSIFFWVCLLYTLGIERVKSLPVIPYQSGQFNIDSNATNSLNLSMFQNSISRILTSDKWIIRQSVSGTLSVFDYQTYSLKSEYLHGSTFQPTEVSKDFSVAKYNSSLFGMLTTSKKAYILALSQNGQSFTSISSFSFSFYNQVLKIQVTSKQILVLIYQNYIHYLRQIWLNTTLKAHIAISPSYPVYEMKVCELSLISAFYFAVTWKNDCYVEIFLCDVSTNCTSKYQYQSLNCAAADFVSTVIQNNFQVQFSQDCSQLIFHQRSVGARIIDTSNFTEINRLDTSSLNVSRIQFIDKENLFIAVILTNGSYLVYQNLPIPSNQAINSGNLPFLGSVIDYNMQKNIIVTVSNGSIYAYKQSCSNSSFALTIQGYCVLCPSNCINCNSSGYCLTCVTNFTMENGQCKQDYKVSDSNITSELNLTLNSTASNNSVSLTTNSSNSAISDNLSNLNNSGNVSNSSIFANDSLILAKNKSNQAYLYPIYDYQESIGNSVHQQFAIPVIYIAEIITTVLQVFPFSFIFMRFINFWSICSFYLLLQMKLPKHLYQILMAIYQAINNSLLKTLGINLSINFIQEEKFPKSLNEIYGLSSDFISSNFQSFIILLFSYVVLLILYVIKAKAQKNRVLEKISFSMAFLGQYVSITNAFYLNIFILKSFSTQKTFQQKVNLSLQIFFITASTVSFAVAFIFIERQNDIYSTNCQKNEQINEWIINILCNSLIPFTAILGYNVLFFFFASLVYVFQVYSSIKKKQSKLNQTILSLHLLSFHIGFTILLIFNYEDFPQIYHHTGIALIFVLVIGATHQILTFFFKLIYYLYKSLAIYLKSVSSNQIVNQNKRQNQSQNISAEGFDIKKVHFVHKNPVKTNFSNQSLILKCNEKQFTQNKNKEREIIISENIQNNLNQKIKSQIFQIKFYKTRKIKQKIKILPLNLYFRKK